MHDHPQSPEAAYRASEARFRAIIDAATDFAILTIDDRGDITSWNHGAERLLGFVEQEVLGRSAAIFFTPEDRARCAPEHELEAARTRGRADDERWHVRRDGSRFWGSGVVTPIAGGGFVKIFRDRTAQHEASRALAAREAEFRTLADTMPQMVWSTRPDGHHDYYNARWYEYTGMRPGTTDGEGWNGMFHPDDRERAWARWRHSLETGEAYEIEYRLRRHDGTYRWTLGRALPLKDEHGRILRWFGTCTDIDDAKRVQHVLHDADRRKDEFLATLAHELRNPLAPIRTFAHVLARPELSPAQLQTAIAVIRRQVAQMARLLDDLLDLARITRERLDLRPELVPLQTIVDTAVEAARPLIESKGHRLHVDLPHDAPSIVVDPVRIAQVLSNLLTNAAKYTDPGGHLELSATTDERELRVTVRDDGIGLPPDVGDELFRMFAQVHGTAGRSGGGLGIGLALAKRLVDMHGGTLEAQSDGPGCGSTFTVRLPLPVER